MSRFEHIRHKPPAQLVCPREFVLVLAPMRSNVNLSRIVRLCGCAAIPKIFQCGPGKVDREIARDAVDVVQIVQRRSLVPTIRELKVDGYQIAGLEQTTNSKNLFEYSFSPRTALVVGAEREGLDQEVLDCLDDVLEIPVFGRPFSYNVATATTMAVYEFCRQHSACIP